MNVTKVATMFIISLPLFAYFVVVCAIHIRYIYYILLVKLGKALWKIERSPRRFSDID